MSQITTITFFHYDNFWAKRWAFSMMQYAHKPMSKVEGLQFYKLMGTGKGKGFNPWPDWSTYAILHIWDDKRYAEDYFDSDLHKRYQKRASKIDSHYLRCITVKGLWSGKQPFDIQEQQDPNSQVAVITRATIKGKELRKFWSYVPTSQKELFTNPDLVYTKGIGEVPLKQMATFSVWNNLESMKNFAYRGRAHGKAIELTRKRDWFSEEMFVRFEVLSSFAKASEDVDHSFAKASEDVDHSFAKASEDVDHSFAKASEDVDHSFAKASEDVDHSYAKASEE